jgi:hypothetical protein
MSGVVRIALHTAPDTVAWRDKSFDYNRVLDIEGEQGMLARAAERPADVTQTHELTVPAWFGLRLLLFFDKYLVNIRTRTSYNCHSFAGAMLLGGNMPYAQGKKIANSIVQQGILSTGAEPLGTQEVIAEQSRTKGAIHSLIVAQEGTPLRLHVVRWLGGLGLDNYDAALQTFFADGSQVATFARSPIVDA